MTVNTRTIISASVVIFLMSITVDSTPLPGDDDHSDVISDVRVLEGAIDGKKFDEIIERRWRRTKSSSIPTTSLNHQQDDRNNGRNKEENNKENRRMDNPLDSPDDNGSDFIGGLSRIKSKDDSITGRTLPHHTVLRSSTLPSSLMTFHTSTQHQEQQHHLAITSPPLHHIHRVHHHPLDGNGFQHGIPQSSSNRFIADSSLPQSHHHPPSSLSPSSRQLHHPDAPDDIVPRASPTLSDNLPEMMEKETIPRAPWENRRTPQRPKNLREWVSRLLTPFVNGG